jgi:hypothetical protein
VSSRLTAIHLNNKSLASMHNDNNTIIIRYLDGGDVCGFVFVFVIGGGSFYLLTNLPTRLCCRFNAAGANV